jgi:diguanylate cyclase (GGDEF)-like protein
MNNDISLSQIENELERYRKLYDALRIIDPVNKRTIGRSDNSDYGLGNISYGYWTDDLISDDSISVRAFKEKSCVMKLVHVADSTYLVTAFPIEIPNGILVLELLNNVTNSLSIGYKDYSDAITNLAFRDELTNLFNRRYVDERLSRDITKAFVEQSPMSVIFLDVDNLKEINDSLGHAFGDKVLIEISDIIIRSIRSDTDWVARYGGDEFLICLNNNEPKETFEIAERIRNKIADLVILQNGTIKTTVSLGIYSTGKHAVTAAEAISYADSKMYEAKRNGKNCTMH